MSRETVAWVTRQPPRASASSSSCCVPIRLRATTLAISFCRAALSSSRACCIDTNKYACRFRRPLKTGNVTLVLHKLLWTAIYGITAAAATIVARKAASRVWRVLTGEEPPTKK